MTTIHTHDPTALNTTLAELPPLPMAALTIGVYQPAPGRSRPAPALLHLGVADQASRSTCSSPASSPACGPSPGGRTASAAP